MLGVNYGWVKSLLSKCYLKTEMRIDLKHWMFNSYKKNDKFTVSKRALIS